MAPPKTQVLIKCHRCHREFSQSPSKLKPKRHFCGRKCWDAYAHAPKPLADMLEMFWAKVIHMPEGCWDWIGGMDTHGYPCWNERVGNESKDIRAYVWIYKTIFGPIPKGYEVDHLCRNKACVNPAHLEAVTRKVNMQRSEAGHHKNHWNQFITHCPKGHPYDEANTYVRRYKDGTVMSRHCRTCHRITEVERRKKRDANETILCVSTLWPTL